MEYKNEIYKEFKHTVLDKIYSLMCTENIYDLKYWNKNTDELQIWFLHKAIIQSKLLLKIFSKEKNISYINVHPYDIEQDVLDTLYSFCYALSPKNSAQPL